MNPTYGVSDVTFNNLVNGDDGNDIGAFTLDSATATATANAGTTHAIVLSGFNDTNYNLVSSTDGTLTITKRDITATVGNRSRSYGDANPTYDAADVTFDNLVNGDTGNDMDAFTIASATATGTSNANTTHAIVLSGFSDDNYNLLSSTDGTLDITKASLNLTVNDATRVQNTANPVFTYTLSGLRNGEDESVVSGVMLTTSAVTGSPIGAYTIFASGGTALNYDVSNYTFGELTVTPAVVIPPSTGTEIPDSVTREINTPYEQNTLTNQASPEYSFDTVQDPAWSEIVIVQDDDVSTTAAQEDEGTLIIMARSLLRRVAGR